MGRRGVTLFFLVISCVLTCRPSSAGCRSQVGQGNNSQALSPFWKETEPLVVRSPSGKNYLLGLSFDVEISFENIRQLILSDPQLKKEMHQIENENVALFNEHGELTFKGKYLWEVRDSTSAKRVVELGAQWFENNFGMRPGTEIDGDPTANVEFKHPSFDSVPSQFARIYPRLLNNLKDYSAEPHLSFPSFIPTESALTIARILESHIHLARMVKKWNRPRKIHYSGYTSLAPLKKAMGGGSSAHSTAGLIRFQANRFKTHVDGDPSQLEGAYNIEFKRSAGVKHEMRLLELGVHLAQSYERLKNYQPINEVGAIDGHFGFMEGALSFAAQIFSGEPRLSQALNALAARWSVESVPAKKTEPVSLALWQETARFLEQHQILEKMLDMDLYVESPL